MPQDAGDGRGGCWGRRRSLEGRSGLLTPIFSDFRVTHDEPVAMRVKRCNFCALWLCLCA
eukprot:3550752-Prymnesium_polylepis.1